MKVLITGSKGFIGQNFIEKMPDEWTITMFDIKDNPETRPSDLDLGDVDWVVHLGALSSTTETDVRRVMDLNVAWSIELAEECIKHNVNLQWASSASVYGNKYRCAVNENHECNPLNLYAQSKYFFEQYMKLKNPHIVWQGFRYFNVYGPHEDHKGSQASPYSQFARQARETGVIRVFEGSENYKRDFIHVDRVIETQLEMMDRNESGIFNLGSGSPRSFLDVARDVALLYNARIETIPFPEHLRSHYQEYTHAIMYKINSIT
jgi:ADP-L-glycero-D-manno-heptose 6-epimerase